MSWNRGLRGSEFEELINRTNLVYQKKNLAIIQKIPTPITPVKFDKVSRNITLAYFDQKSSVDFMGVVQGIPICFDAKETNQKNLPLQNIHQHQLDFMAAFTAQQGLAFLLVHFKQYNECYYLPFETLLAHWQIAQSGGRKSIPYDAFDKALLVPFEGIYLNYLAVVSQVLERTS